MNAYKNGIRPLVLIAARISGGKNQKEASLEDQEDHAREVAAEIFPNIDCDFKVCKVIVKGERIDRADLSEIEACLKTGLVDLFLMEDVGRLVRGTRAKDLFCLAASKGTRVIAINNNIDSIKPTWESELIKQCGEEVAYTETLSNRITFKSLNRFKKTGHTARRPVPGYDVPDGAKSYFEWKRDEEATPIIQQGAELYLRTKNLTAVAEFFNSAKYKGRIGFPVGPCCKKRTSWNGHYVGVYFENPTICGRPARQRKKNSKDHDSGRRRPRKHDNPTYISCPHLAHISQSLFDEINACRRSVNGRFKRKDQNGRDPLSEVARGMSKFPGMHAVCSYCGSPYNWGANGIVSSLMCSGSRCRVCWNSRGVPGVLTNQRLAAMLTECMFAVEGFAAEYRAAVEQALIQPAASIQTEITSLMSQQAEARRSLSNLAAAIARNGSDDEIIAGQDQARAKLASIARRLDELKAAAVTAPNVPHTVAELQLLFQPVLANLMSGERSTATELKAIFPSIKIELVAYIDKPGYPLPRARVVLDLGGLLPDAKRVDGLPMLLRHERVIELFERPQRDRIRAEAARIRATDPKLTYTQIAAQIVDQGKHPTDTAVGHALKLHDKMTKLGLESPLVHLDGPEALSRKFKRPHHKNYQQKQPPDHGST